MASRALTCFAVAALATALIAAALGLAAGANRGDAPSVARSEQKLKLGNNKSGRTIIRFYGMAPGDSRKRRVRISNRRGPARVKLDAVALKAAAGPNGGSLADALRIRVRRMRKGQGKRARLSRTVHNGPLSEMAKSKPGRYRARSAGDFRFKIRFPTNGTALSPLKGDNAYQGAKAKVKFRWRAQGAR